MKVLVLGAGVIGVTTAWVSQQVRPRRQTVPVADAAKAYSVSLTDDEYKLVFSRLGDRPRIAGTAELNGYSTELNEVRCRALLRRT